MREGFSPVLPEEISGLSGRLKNGFRVRGCLAPVRPDIVNCLHPPHDSAMTTQPNITSISSYHREKTKSKTAHDQEIIYTTILPSQQPDEVDNLKGSLNHELIASSHETYDSVMPWHHEYSLLEASFRRATVRVYVPPSLTISSCLISFTTQSLIYV